MFFVFAALGLAEGGEGQGDLEVEQSGTNCQCSKSQDIIEVGNSYFFRLLLSLEDFIKNPKSVKQISFPLQNLKLQPAKEVDVFAS